MPALDPVAAIDTLIAETADAANRAALAVGGSFDRLSLGTSAGIRLKALQDARAAVVVAGIRKYEQSAVDSSV